MPVSRCKDYVETARDLLLRLQANYNTMNNEAIWNPCFTLSAAILLNGCL